MSELIAAALAAAQLLARLEQADAATALYRAILTQAPDNAPAHAALGYNARECGDRAAAAAHFVHAVAAPAPDPWLLLDAADNLLALDRAEEASALYARLAALEPGNARAQSGLAYAARAQGHNSAARAYFATALRLLPDAVWLMLDAADNLLELKQNAEAEALFRAALALEPESARAHTRLAYLTRERGERETARLHFAAALRHQPEAAWLMQDAADNLLALGRLDEAQAAYNAVLAHDPAQSRAQAGLAYIAAQRGNRTAAQEHFDEALRLAPATAWLMLDSADNLRALARLDAAAALYTALLEREPNHARAYAGLGYVSHMRGESAHALAQFDEALHRDPGNLWLYIDKTTVQLETGDFAGARETALAAQARFTDSVPALLNLAEAERVAGVHEAALAALQQAHNLAPRDAAIIARMAAEELRLGQMDECAAHLLAARALDPFCPAVVHGMAEQLFRADNPGEALALFQAATAANPHELSFELGMLDALVSLGAVEPLLALCEDLQARHGPHPTILTARIGVLRRTGRLAEAAAAGRAARALRPQDFWVWNEAQLAEKYYCTDAELEALLAAAPAHTWREKAALARATGAAAELRYDHAAADAAYKAGLAYSREDPGIAYDLVRMAMLRMEIGEAVTYLRLHRDLEAPSIRLRGRSLNLSQSLYGQLVDEYRLNEIPPRVRPLLDLPPAERAAGLLALCVENPDNSAAAMELAVALRLAGSLDRFTHPGGAPIPRQILQFWDSEEVPEDIAAYRASWQEQNPAYTLRPFNARTALAYLQANFPPPVAVAFQRSREAAQKADLFRLAFLFAEGGVYSDADDRCQVPLETLVPEDASLVLFQEDLGTLANNFMAVAPRHPLIRMALEAGVNAINRGDSEIVWLCTGPAMLTRVFAQAWARGAEALPGLTVVADLRTLYRSVAIHCAAAYKISTRHWLNANFAKRPGLDNEAEPAA